MVVVQLGAWALDFENVRSVGQRDEGLNQMVERVNNTVRYREKTFRGMDNDKSAQIMADGIRINYNFIHPHMGLDGRTPAEAAGIRVEGENKWLTLIQNASISKGHGTTQNVFGHEQEANH